MIVIGTRVGPDTTKVVDVRDEAEHAMRMLSFRERTVIECRMKGMTLKEVAHVLAVTRERVRIIEARAMSRLRQKAKP
jgi:RNA polymerase primary sigma factor